MDLVSRVKGILLTPKSEWATIDTEPATVGGLYTGYIIPLAAIPAIAGFIGNAFIGRLGYRWGMGAAITAALVGFIGAVVGTYILALIIDALAPSFGGQKSQIQALKVAAFSATASWVAGIFAILPPLAILSILGLYSLYLLFLGLPTLMKAPQEKAMGYTVVVIVCMIVLYFIIGAVTLAVVGSAAMGVGALRP